MLYTVQNSLCFIVYNSVVLLINTLITTTTTTTTTITTVLSPLLALLSIYCTNDKLITILYEV